MPGHIQSSAGHAELTEPDRELFSAARLVILQPPSNRDQLVQTAGERDDAASAHLQQEPIRAALWDFLGNSTLSALPKAVSGLAVILAYPQVAYQGWAGGIVSKSSNGLSRFGDIQGTIYYVVGVFKPLESMGLRINRFKSNKSTVEEFGDAGAYLF
jgi:hypothetical protein